MSKSLAECMSQAMFRRSADPRHPDNALDADWQAGYFFGCLDDGRHELWEDSHPITVEWRLRGEPGAEDQQFKHWKMGYHAGCLSKIEKQTGRL